MIKLIYLYKMTFFTMELIWLIAWLHFPYFLVRYRVKQSETFTVWLCCRFGFLWSMDAFTHIGWFLYLLILIKYGCIYRHWLVSVHISWFLSSMDAFTDIGWFLYISLDSYEVWMHIQTLVGFCTYLLILIKYGCIYRHWLVSVHISWFLSSMDAFTDIGWFLYISLDSYEVWMHSQTLVGFCTYLWILIKYGCIHRHWLVSVHISWFL